MKERCGKSVWWERRVLWNVQSESSDQKQKNQDDADEVNQKNDFNDTLMLIKKSY